MNDFWAALLGGLGLLAGLALYWNTFVSLKIRRAMADTPTSKVRSGAMGQIELKGLAKAWEFALQAPFSEAACAWFRWTVEEEKVSYTRRGRQKSWVEIAAGQSLRPFFLEDDTGQVKVNPAGAEVTAARLMNHTSGGFFGSHLGLHTAAARKYLSTPNRVRLSEWRIDLGLPIYVLGVLKNVRLDDSSLENQVKSGDHGEPFLVSVKTEEEMRKGTFWEAWGSVIGGTLLTMACTGWLLARFVAPHVGFDFLTEVDKVISIAPVKVKQASVESKALAEGLEYLRQKEAAEQAQEKKYDEDYY